MPYLLPIMSLLLFLPAAPPVEPTGAEPASLEVGAVAGFQVVVDPATGRIVNNPTDLQLDRLAEGIAIERRRSSWELREFRLANVSDEIDSSFTRLDEFGFGSGITKTTLTQTAL